MTDCDRIRGDLKSYADAELPLLRRPAVRRHLARCAACREELEQMAQITESLREAAQEDAQDINPALRERLVSLPAYSHAAPARPRRAAPLVGSLALAGVVSVVVLGGLLFFHARTSDDINAKMVPESAPMAQETAPSLPSGIPASVRANIPVHYGGQEADSQSAVTNSPAPGGAAATSAGTTETAALDTVDRRVHKEASITVSVGDPEAGSDDISAMARAAGGYISDNNLETGTDGLRTATMTVKVPVAEFETTLQQIAHMGKVIAKAVTGQDITDQVSDANQKETVLDDEANQAKAKLALLGHKADWEDNEAVRDLRVQLAQARARLVLLKKMGEVSSIAVTLTETQKPPAPSATTAGFMDNMTDTGRSAFGSFLAAVEVLMTGVIWMVIFAPIWLPIAYCCRWFYRRWIVQSSPS